MQAIYLIILVVVLGLTSGSTIAAPARSTHKTATGAAKTVPPILKPTSLNQPQAVEAAIPYSLKNIQLGISLAEFRTLPFPATQRDMQSSTNIQRAFCSCDNAPGIPYITNWSRKEFGGLSCEYKRTSGDRVEFGLPADWYDQHLSIANVPCETHFNFIDVGGNDYRLYDITAQVDPQAFEEIVDAMSEKYGKPQVSKYTAIHNRMGAEFNQHYVIWKNGSSTIAGMRYGSSIGHGWLNFQHDQLHKLYKQRTQNFDGKPSADL